jgi:hypothetical protein
MVNLDKIKEIKAKYPEITTEETCNKIKDLYQQLVTERKLLTKLRTEVLCQEKKVKKVEEIFFKYSPLFDITFEEEQVKEIQGSCNLGIINPSDYRNNNQTL